jgi:hypothetical protein
MIYKRCYFLHDLITTKNLGLDFIETIKLGGACAIGLRNSKDKIFVLMRDDLFGGELENQPSLKKVSFYIKPREIENVCTYCFNWPLFAIITNIELTNR